MKTKKTRVFLTALFVTTIGHAANTTYDPATGTVTIPEVWVGGKVELANVKLQKEPDGRFSIFSPEIPKPSPYATTYDPDTGTATIPKVMVGGKVAYTNVELEFNPDGKLSVISNEAPPEAPPEEHPVLDRSCYDPATGTAIIPEVWVGDKVAYRNVELKLEPDGRFVISGIPTPPYATTYDPATGTATIPKVVVGGKVAYTNVKLEFNPDGTLSVISNEETVNPFAPDESPHPIAYYEFPPKPGFSAALGWMQAIQIQDSDNLPSKVEVDWMKLHAIVNGVDTVIYADHFDSPTDADDCKSLADAMKFYGLYNREPWFRCDRIRDMPFKVKNDNLVLNPSERPGYVFHWWNTSRSPIPADASKIWFEARVRITGGAGVQAGIDYWRGEDPEIKYEGYDVNNTEAGTSDWYGNSSTEYQIIRVGHP
jgi:hypothetical protein